MPHIIRDKVYTSHALMDEIVYHSKLILEGIVLKDESTANANETPYSLDEGNYLVLIGNNRLDVFSFPFTMTMLTTSKENGGCGLSAETATAYINNPALIPESNPDPNILTRAEILDICSKWYIDHYVEENNYYRMLNGIPPFNQDKCNFDYVNISVNKNQYGIKILDPYDQDNWVAKFSAVQANTEEKTRQLMYSKLIIDRLNYIFRYIENDEQRKQKAQEYLYNIINFKGEDKDKMLHEYSTNQINFLESVGVISYIKQEYITNNNYSRSCYRYINHLGSKKVDLVEARTAAQWDIIYIPEVNYYILNKFKELFVINRDIYLKRTNQLAYSVDSDYYEQMLMFIVVAQTFNDMIVDTPEWYIRRDIIDIRSAQYFLEANGVQFFNDIPLRFQTKIIKNLNKLIRYKSTTKNILDILNIFNYENTIVYKYYLMKKHEKVDFSPEIDPAVTPSEDDPEEIYWRNLTVLDFGYEEDPNPDPETKLFDFNPDNTLPIYDYDFSNDSGYIPDSTDETIRKQDYYESSVRKVTDEWGNIYSLEFIKAPIDENYDNYIFNTMYHEGYDEITYQDKYWDGQDLHSYVKNEHLKKPFTIEGTKIMGLEFEVFMDQYLFEREYYLGLLFNNNIDIEDLTISIPLIDPNMKFNVRSLLIFLYCCNGLYTNMDITINNPLEEKERRKTAQPKFASYKLYDNNTYGDYTNEIVQSLPTVGVANKVYLVKSNGTKFEKDSYREYIWLPDKNKYLEVTNAQNGHYPDQLFDFHEFDDGGDTVYSSNIMQSTFYDYIRTDHSYVKPDIDGNFKNIYLDLMGRIYGFNMNVDLDQIQDYIGFRHSTFGFDHGFDLKDLIGTVTNSYGKEELGYIVAKKITSFDELYKIYTQNKECYQNLKKKYQNASNRDERRIYDYVYYSLFTLDYDREFYKLSDGSYATTYDQILLKYDPILYGLYEELKAEPDMNARTMYLNELVDCIIDTLNYYLNGDNLKYILNFVNNNSIDAIIHYIHEMICFFKSWKVYFLDPKANYIISDRGSLGPEYMVTYGDQLGELREKFWTVENLKLADSVEVKNHYYIRDQLKDNPNYNAEVVDIAAHYIDHDILGDKYFDGYEASPSSEEITILDAGEPNRASYSPYYVYNSGLISARKKILELEGGTPFDALEYIVIDGGNINDMDIQFKPQQDALDHTEKYYNVNCGWVTARLITDKTTVVKVDSGYCENYDETRPAEDIPYSRNRVTLTARISNYDNNGIELLDGGLYFNNKYALESDLTERFNISYSFEQYKLSEIEEMMDIIQAVQSPEDLLDYIDKKYQSIFKTPKYVMDIMQGDTLEEILIEDGEQKIQVNLIDWFNEINPFVWRDFEGNIITE